MKIISIKYDYDKEMYVISHISKNINGAEVIKTVSVKELTSEMKTFVSDSTVIQTENTTYWK